MKRLAAVLVAALLSGCVTVEPPEPAPPEPPAQANEQLLTQLEELASFPELQFSTEHGDIRMLLYTQWLPITTGHISSLVQRGFYDDTIIHRVVDDFVIQGGDPTGTGEGGSGPAGTSDMIPLEIKDGLQFGSGAVGLARWTDDTGDSQWFITEKPALHLNDPQGTTGEVFGAYSLFAQVFDGMEVVRKIAAVETLPNDRPITDVTLVAATMLPPPHDVNLIGLIPEVLEPFDLWYARDAAIEVPRYAVVGQPLTISIFVTPTEGVAGDAPTCSSLAPQGNRFGTAGNYTEVAFEPTSDPCTYNATFYPDQSGTWTFTGTDAPRAGVARQVTIEVLAWHDDYLPFTGTVMNGA